MTNFSKFSLAVLCLAGAAFPLHAEAQATAHHVTFDQSSEEPYAIVRDGARTTFVGRHQRDDDEVEALRKQYPGKFLWFRDSGKAYVVRDPATVARVEAAWARTDQLSGDMKQYDVPMHEKSAAMEALSKKMVAATHGARAESAEAKAIGEQMKELGKTMEGLGKQMGALGKQIERESKQADASARAVLREALRKGTAQPAVAGS